MTLIAHSIGFKVPFIVGDILLSCDEIQKPFTPPTIFIDVSDYLNETDRKDFPCELAQKVYIITPQLAIALAGNVRQMTKFLKELKHQCKFYDNKVKAEHIHRILQNYDLPNDFGKAAFYMMHIEHTDKDSIYVSEFNYGNWDSVETQIYKDVSSIGSGATSFNKWANDDVEFTSSYEKGDIYYAIQSNVCLIAKLLAIERSSLATLKKNWGAGFEMVFYTGETFIKYQNIAYLLFEADFDDIGNIGDPILSKIMYYKYIDEVLVIISIDLISATYREEKHQLYIKADKLRVGTFPVFAIDLEEALDENRFANDISFLTYEVGVGYIIRKEKERLFIPCFYNNGPEVKVEFQQQKSLEVTMRPEIIEKIREGAKKAYLKV